MKEKNNDFKGPAGTLFKSVMQLRPNEKEFHAT